MKKPNTLLLLACGILPFFMSGCTMADLEALSASQEPEIPPEVLAPSPSTASAVGTWAGTVVFHHQGQMVPFSLIASVPPSKDRVVCVINNSDTEAVAAKWIGNTVSWSAAADRSNTRFFLTPISPTTARVIGRFDHSSGITVKGTGTLIRQ